MARILTLGQTSLPSGAGSQTPAVNIPSAANVCILAINQVGWPHTGEQCGFFRLSYTLDQGATWIELMSSPIMDVAEPAVKSFPANQMRFAASLADIGSVRRLKIEWSFTKALTISGTLDAS